MNTKAIIASALFTSVLAGTTAFAGDNDHFAAADYPTTTESATTNKVNYQASTVIIDSDAVVSGRK